LLHCRGLAGLYPNHGSFVKAVEGSADNLVREGVVLPEGASTLETSASRSDVGF
jgi:hypothetical protein